MVKKIKQYFRRRKTKKLIIELEKEKRKIREYAGESLYNIDTLQAEYRIRCIREKLEILRDTHQKEWHVG